MERGEKVSCLVRDRLRLKAPRDNAELGCRKGTMTNFTPTMNNNMARTEGSVLNRATRQRRTGLQKGNNDKFHPHHEQQYGKDRGLSAQPRHETTPNWAAEREQ